MRAHEDGRAPRPVVFGEVLFDRFEDGHAVLGGAPFNVAWHLQGFGLDPLFISRIGRDAAGDEVLEAMTRWGMQTNGVQRDDAHPTGNVHITLADGQPSYEIAPDQAWDFIDSKPALRLLADTGGALLYHGSLALRQPVSADTLQQLAAATRLPAFIDINLRDPWWSSESARAQLAGGRWLKLNEEELDAVRGGAVEAADLSRAAQQFRAQQGLEMLIVTRGAEGALIVDAGGVIEGEPVPVAKLVDTVGAGDAFSAVFILGLTRGWPLGQTLERALAFASGICGQRGATPPNPDFYHRYIAGWGP